MQHVGPVTPDWVQSRFQELGVQDSSSALVKRDALSGGEVEVSEAQLVLALGEANLGTQWLRERCANGSW
jgi:hypothetical protein